MTWLSRPRHSVEAPLALAGCRVVGVDEAANSVFPSRNAECDQILHRQRRRWEAVAQLVVGGGYVPDDATGFRVERNQVCIKRAEDNLVAENRKTTIDASAARTNVGRQLALIEPDGPPGAAVEGGGAVAWIDLIERAEAASRVVSGVGQPVLRLLRGVAQPFERDLRPSLTGKRAEQCAGREETYQCRKKHRPESSPQR